MSAIYFYDDATARTFEPFALTRPAAELRAGALLVRERWIRALGATPAGQITSAHLAGFDEPDAAPVLAEGVIPAGAWLVNARFAPALSSAPHGLLWRADGEIAAVKLAEPLDIARLRDGRLALGDVAGNADAVDVSGWWMAEVWDYIRHLVPMLERDIPVIGAGMPRALPLGCYQVGTNQIYIEKGAVIEPGVSFDVTTGPILVRAGAHVQSFTRVVGPLYVGAGSTVTADRIAASSIGDVSKVHGEVSNTIFIGYANKGHDGFVGHSIIGRWVNLGAGTITSNLKNTYGMVQLWTPSGVRETGMQFLGTLFGDHAKTGIGLRLTTGTVLGAGANVYGSVMPPKAVAPFAWGEPGAFTTYRADKFLEVAERMMKRRHMTLTERGKQQLLASYAARWTASP